MHYFLPRKVLIIELLAGGGVGVQIPITGIPFHSQSAPVRMMRYNPS